MSVFRCHMTHVHHHSNQIHERTPRKELGWSLQASCFIITSCLCASRTSREHWPTGSIRLQHSACSLIRLDLSFSSTVDSGQWVSHFIKLQKQQTQKITAPSTFLISKYVYCIRYYLKAFRNRRHECRCVVRPPKPRLRVRPSRNQNQNSAWKVGKGKGDGY